MTSPITITNEMSREDLRKLKPAKAKKVVLLVDGEKYPEHEYKADDVENFVGINGKVVFK
jgi:hypothetical protein